MVGPITARPPASPPPLPTRSLNLSTTVVGDVKDLGLATVGYQRIVWAERDMPVLRAIRERFEAEKPLAGLRMSACLHVTAETANLARTLVAGGADLVLVASNPLSTQDDVAASLVNDFGIPSTPSRARTSRATTGTSPPPCKHQPHVTMDDGADLVSAMIFIALDRLDDVHPEVRGWAETLDAGRAEAAWSATSSPAWRRRPPASSGSARWRRTAS